MAFLDIARPLLNRGFSVIPIEPAGKRPLGGFGATSRTKDPAVVEGWAKLYPDANVAICADEDTVILETDDADSFLNVIRGGTGQYPPSTLRACGSSENRPHLFFKRTEKATNVGNLAVPGLFEARFSNQYVVAPGSIHPSGAVYRWLNDGPIVEIPDWLVSELARLALSNKDKTARVIETLGGTVPEGSRHYYLMQQAGRLWDGEKTEETLYNELTTLNEKNCDPPREPSHVLQCVRDVMKREPFDPGPRVLIGSSSSSSTSGSPPNPTVPEGIEWTSLSADDLIRKDIPPRKAILSEAGGVLLYEQSVNQILAWRGVGKTNFALGLAGALASGARILGFQPVANRRVLYLDGELPLAQLQERVRGFIPDDCRDNVRLFSPEMLPSPRGLNLLKQNDFDSLLKLVDRHKTEVIFLDSQSTLMPGDSTKDEFQEVRMNVLRQLRWRGLCIIEMHHVGKSGLQRGLSKNDDILDIQMYLKKSKDWEPEDGLEFEICYEKVRHAASLDSGYKVRLQDGQWVKLAADETAEAAEYYNAGLSQREIGRKLKCSTSKVNRLIKRAIDAGLAVPKIKLKSEK